MCGSAFSLGWAPARREVPLGEEEGILSGVNSSVTSFSKLGSYAGIFNNLNPSIARMNNPSHNLTNL